MRLLRVNMTPYNPDTLKYSTMIAVPQLPVRHLTKSPTFISLPDYLYNIASSDTAVNGLFVKEMSSLADNFDFIVPWPNNVIRSAFDAPHLPYAIFIIVRCHADKTVIWAIPFNASKPAITIKGTNKITVLHQSASSQLGAHRAVCP